MAELRQARAEAEARRQQMEQAQQVAGAAKDLAGAEMGGDNALSRLVDQSQAGALQ